MMRKAMACGSTTDPEASPYKDHHVLWNGYQYGSHGTYRMLWWEYLDLYALAPYAGLVERREDATGFRILAISLATLTH